MEEDLDHILLDQYHVSKYLQRKMKRARKLIGDDPLLLQFQECNDKRMLFFESMIEDKSILHKKKRKSINRSDDLLAKHPLVEFYKYAWVSTFCSYNMAIKYVQNYLSMFTKK